MSKPQNSGSTPQLSTGKTGPNPAINKGFLFWGRVLILLGLVVVAGIVASMIIPNPF